MTEKQYKGIKIKVKNKKGQLLKEYCFPEILSIIENIEKFIKDTQCFTPIKDDAKTTVGVIKGVRFNLSFSLIIKRLNYKSMPQYFIKNLIRNRAKHFYKVNLQFLKMGLGVPELIGFFETDKLKKGYCISKYIDNAENLSNIYKKGLFHEPGKIARQLAQTIAQWHLAGAVHGDLKWSNILFQKNNEEYKFFLVDLDQSQLKPKPSIKLIEKDLTRFYRYSLELGAEKWVDSEFFPHYIGVIPDKLKTKIDLDCIRKKAWNDWVRNGKRKFALD